jgi:predicted nucleic acid-binding protein
VVSWAGSVHRIALSVVTIEEVMFGLARKPSNRVRLWFDGFLAAHCEILEVTSPIAILAGNLRGQLAARGIVRTQADILIAATAAHHGLMLVTRNTRDFADCGIAVLNPFV